jgi:hypothetical protein
VAVYGGEWSASPPPPAPGERHPDIHSTGGWVGHRPCMDTAVAKRKIPAAAAVSHFTNWAIPDRGKAGHYEGVSKSFRTESITKYMLTTTNTHCEATQRVMAVKLTRLTHKIVILLQLVAESCTICSSRARRPVRKLLDTPSYKFYE